MNKALVLALFLGLATATESQGWKMPDTGLYEWIANEDQYALGYKLQADAGYATHYSAPVDQAGNDWAEQVYGLHLYSFASAFLTLRLTQFYTWTGDFFFEPLYWEVYNQHVRYTRVEAENGLHFYVSGDRMGRALRLSTTTTQNMQTFERSLVEFLLDDNNNYEILPQLDD